MLIIINLLRSFCTVEAGTGTSCISVYYFLLTSFLSQNFIDVSLSRASSIVMLLPDESSIGLSLFLYLTQLLPLHSFRSLSCLCSLVTEISLMSRPCSVVVRRVQCLLFCYLNLSAFRLPYNTVHLVSFYFLLIMSLSSLLCDYCAQKPWIRPTGL